MNEHDRKSLKAIKKHIYSIQSYCKNCNGLDEFTSDPMLVEACVFNIMQIGEISKSELSEECKELITSIPWKQIYGMRNRIVHGYDGIKMRVVWDTICDDLPALLDEIDKAL